MHFAAQTHVGKQILIADLWSTKL